MTMAATRTKAPDAALGPGLLVTPLEPLRLDIVAARATGDARRGGLEGLLAANPGLAEGGAYAEENRTLKAPPRREPVTVLRAVNPWD